MMTLCIQSKVYENIRTDLRRSHPFAAERVGFVFVHNINNKLEITGYMTVPDECYIKDPTVGASINHQAISSAMMRAYKTKEGIFQVHEHGGYGVPSFSRIDIKSHPDFLQSFRNANSKGIHGFLLLSEDRILTRYWLAGQSNYVDSISVTISSKSWWKRLWRRIGL